MKLETIKPSIHHVIFPTQIEMSQALVRFYAYVDSEKFSGKIFSEDEFRKWYTESHQGIDTFNLDWSGFNISDKVLKIFREGQFNPLSGKETDFLELTKNLSGEFSIIATFENYQYLHETLPHEIAHALFYNNENYRQEVLMTMKQFDIEALKNFIMEKWNYNTEVIEDECQAFLLTNKDMLREEGFDVETYALIRNKIKDIYERYTK